MRQNREHCQLGGVQSAKKCSKYRFKACAQCLKQFYIPQVFMRQWGHESLQPCVQWSCESFICQFMRQCIERVRKNSHRLCCRPLRLQKDCLAQPRIQMHSLAYRETASHAFLLRYLSLSSILSRFALRLKGTISAGRPLMALAQRASSACERR